MSTPNDMPAKARPLSKTEERRLRGRTSNRLVLLARNHLSDMSGDEMLALNEYIDAFYRERDEMRGEMHDDTEQTTPRRAVTG